MESHFFLSVIWINAAVILEFLLSTVWYGRLTLKLRLYTLNCIAVGVNIVHIGNIHCAFFYLSSSLSFSSSLNQIVHSVWKTRRLWNAIVITFSFGRYILKIDASFCCCLLLWYFFAIEYVNLMWCDVCCWCISKPQYY